MRGAWIEVDSPYNQLLILFVAPFGGAWIEVLPYNQVNVAARVAPRRGAWVEVEARTAFVASLVSHHAMVRGLK